MKKSIAIIGGGPAGLMAAETLSQHNLKIDVYDAMPSLGRKFLMAGKSGLNLTHAEDYPTFVTRYGNKQDKIAPYLELFKPSDVIQWTNDLGIETFTGTSGRIFPKEMKASPLLRAWLQRLKDNGVNFHLRHRWLGWQDQQLVFETPNGEITVKPDASIFALGGASWPKLGSRGDWIQLFETKGIKVNPFHPSNCGFIVNWSKHFSEKFQGHPIKSVILSFEDFKQQGEFIISKSGLEGSLIYTASAKIRDQLISSGNAVITLDLAPGLSKEKLIAALSRPRGTNTLSNHIKKTINIQGVKLGFLYEFISKENLNDIDKLASAIKALPIPLKATYPLKTAISSAGGVCFEELDSHLMLHKIPGVFCAGEMLDWEAPTGGYLLTACFATGIVAGKGVLKWLRKDV